jgi:DnaJ-class molecular chaperone
MTNTDTQRGADDETRIQTDIATYRMVTITCPKCNGTGFRGTSIIEVCNRCCGRRKYGVLVKNAESIPVEVTP